MTTRERLPHLPIVPGPGGPQARMAASEAEKPKDARQTLHRLWTYLRCRRAPLLVVFLLVAAGAALGLIGPFLMGKAIDAYILQNDLPGLARISLVMLAAYATAALMTWLQSYVMASVAQLTVRELRDVLFARLQSLSLRFFDRRSSGELMSRFTN